VLPADLFFGGLGFGFSGTKYFAGYQKEISNTNTNNNNYVYF